jgi:hypothetical protein
MNEAKHTPGPWSFDGDGFDSVAAQHCGTDGYIVFQVLGDDKLNSICEIDPQTDDSEAEANARLIAAAPDLLKALEIAEDMLKQCMKQTHFTLGACGNMTKISEIIAKAKGAA